MKLSRALLIKKPEAVFVFFLVIFFTLIYSLRSIIAPFLIGMISAYFLNHPVGFLKKLHIPRGISSFVMVFGFLVMMILFVIESVPVLQAELRHLSTGMTTFVDFIFKTLEPLKYYFPNISIEQFKTEFSNKIQDLTTFGIQGFIQLLGTGASIINSLGMVFLTFIVTFYMAKDFESFSKNAQKLFPKKYLPILYHQGQKINKALSSYAKGQMKVCGLLFIMYVIGFSLIGFPKTFSMATLASICALVPYVGNFICFILSLAIAYNHEVSCLSVCFVFMIIPGIENNIITPRLIGAALGVHPVWIMFLMLAGVCWFGVIGLFLALPSAAVLSIVVKHVMSFYYQSVDHMV
jgi:predicted PurR-regulated permease PerM